MPVHTEIVEGIGRLILDRPERAHAYDRTHLDALDAGFQELAERVHVVIISSTGERAFCGGADLKAMEKADPLDALDLRSQEVFTRIARSPVVSIAAVQGAAVAGGCELALACDLRVVGPRASFQLPETALGLIPSAGGCTRLTRLLGPSLAKQVILAGRQLGAEEAVRFGLAIAQNPDPLARALTLGRTLAERDPVALRLAKQVIDLGEDRRSLDAERVSEALLYTRKAQASLKGS